MKRFARLAAVAIAAMVLAMSCSKDKDSGKITFDSERAYISAEGGSTVMGFTTSNVKMSTITVSSYPTGWAEPVLDITTRKVSVTAPEDLTADKTDATGMVKLSGMTPDGTAVTGSFFVGVVSTVDMSGKVANCYLVSQKETNYIFDATRGDLASVLADHVGIVWATSSSLIQYLDLNGTKVSFYVGANTSDNTVIKEGNALIGAYDAKNNLLWTWHIWSSNYDIEADAMTYTNGYTVMSRNLGALDNDNSTTDKILASYGLYYQWGRKDPFIGPSTYSASNGAGASTYDVKGNRVLVTMEECTATIGTDDYARQHPTVYITGTAASNYDWLYSGSSNSRWGSSSDLLSKTVNDPCPFGWKVAPAAAFNGLSIVEDLTADYSEYADSYGWTLTDGATQSLWMSGGFRRYDNGKIQNIYNPTPVRANQAMEAQPWEGLFWTTDTDGSQASAFYFWFYKSNVAGSGLKNKAGYSRSNGLFVRCVKQRAR